MAIEHNTAEFQQPVAAVENKYDNVLDIQAIIGACLSKWWLFMISVLIVMSLTIFYLMLTPKIYTRTATFLIKESGGKTSSFNSQLNSSF